METRILGELEGIQTEWGAMVLTKDGSYTIRNPEIDECYHCFQGAIFEARILYLKTSGMEDRLLAPNPDGTARPINLLDVGLGLGYNALTSIEAWLQAPAPPSLYVQSLEILGSLVAAMASGEALWQKNWSAEMLTGATCLKQKPDGNWSGEIVHPSAKATLKWDVLIGDAAKLTLDMPEGGYEFVWQDPFSPGKGGTLWSATWFAEVGRVSTPGCRMMTFSVARMYRDNLAAAGWSWKKVKGPKPGKRQWSQATWGLGPEAIPAVSVEPH